MAGPNTLNFGQKVVFLGGNALTMPVRSSDPGSAVAGDTYYSTATNRVRIYNGSAWGNDNDGGTAANITATSNSTLTTLSALSLPASQLTGLSTAVASLTAANISATSNATLTTLSALSLPFSQLTSVSVSLTTQVSGVLPIANGGTNNGSLAVTAGGVLYTDGTKIVNVGAGTSGYVLQSNGASAPTWVSPASGSVTAVSVASANGFSGTSSGGATPALTLSTTVTSGSILKSSSGSIVAAVSGTDYVIPSGSITGTASNITASSNATLTTLSALSLPFSQLTSVSVSLTTQVSGVLPLANGGTNANLTAANGGIVYSTASAMAILAAGSTGQLLQSNGAAAPSWVNNSGFTYVSSNTSVYGGTNGTLSFTGAHNTVIGSASGLNIGTGTDNTILGYGANSNANSTANNSHAIAIGSNASAGPDDIVIGYNSYGSSSSSGHNLLLGNSISTGPASTYDTIIGHGIIASNALYSVAIGNSVTAFGTGQVVIGTGAQANNNNTIVLTPGDTSTATQSDTNTHQLVIGDSRTNAYISQVWLGRGAVAVSTPQAVQMALTPATGSNVAGSNFTFQPGNGTGTGGSGSIIFQTAPVAGSSSTANTMTTALTIKPSGVIQFSTGYNYGAIVSDGSGNLSSVNNATSGYILTSNGSSASPSFQALAAVTSVGLSEGSASPIYNITNSPVTSTGTLTFTLKSQAQNLVFASPNGSSGQPSFRSLVANDIPALSGLYLSLSAGGTMAASINMGTNSITNMANPTNPQDAATKYYVDNSVAGLTWKNAVQAASAGSNINLSAPGATLDGYTFASGDRFLAKDQSTASANGIYIWNGAAAAATRSSDMNTWSEVVGAVMLVINGTTNAGSKWVNTNTAGGTLGTTNITFTAFSVAGSVSGTGTANYVAYWSGTSTLSSEQYLAASRGGTAGDSSAQTGIAHVASGVWSYSSIVNADISGSAAIAYSKLASMSTGQILLGNGGTPTATTMGGDATIGATGTLTLATVNASPNTYALATITVNGKGLVTSASAASTTGSGSVVLATSPTLVTPVLGAATGTSLQLSGLTASQAVFTDGSKNLVSNAITGTGSVVMSASPTLTGTITAAAANFSGALGANGGITSTGALLINANSGSSNITLYAGSVKRTSDNATFITEQYIDATVLTDNSGPTAVASFQFAVASFAGVEITYVIESGNANADRRIGTLRVTANASGTIAPSIVDMYAESADCGVSWTATNSSGTISVLYTCTNQGSNRTMRSDLKFIRA